MNGEDMKDPHLKSQHTLLNRLTLGLLLCAFAFVTAQAQNETPHHGDKTPATKRARKQAPQVRQVYSCPMHPSVKGKSGTKCPKCGMKLVASRDDEASPEPAVASSEAGRERLPAQLSKMNIPDIEALDQNGRKINFYTDLVKGQTVAINFIFTTCTTICPPLGATFARVQKVLGDKVGRDVRFISISVDPATDTPERLKAWGEKFHAGDGWTFVTGNKPQIDELLRALGASSASMEDHSPTILIGNDAHGVWTRTYGLAKATQLVQIINDAIAGKIATTTPETSK
jgi:cytochrome oxidase Cu insertion factor (SCO1/SenC/PrrC family)